MYKVGQQYKWQNQVGVYAALNGTVCRIIRPMKMRRHPLGFRMPTWETDSLWMYKGKPDNMLAFRGDLLPIQDPDLVRLEIEESVAA